MRSGWLVSLLVVASATTWSWAQDGYLIRGNRIHVDTPTHWQAWDGAVGSYLIGADGRVEPRFARSNINAMLNASEFETVTVIGDTIIGGVQNAGTESETAHHIIDGDPTTYWEPERKHPLDLWFVEINLGRSVIGRRIVVRFAEEGSGDPFLKFRVVLSDGRTSTRASGQRGALKFFRGGQATRPNKTQQEFVFDIKPQRPTPDHVDGEVVQVLRFEALDTDGPRGTRIDSVAYATLDSLDRGAIDYYRVTVAGRQIPIDRPTWLALPVEEQAPIRYFRHERPRLAEIELHTPGDNIISLTQRILNQGQDLFQNPVLALSTDGVFTSLYPLRVYNPLRHRNQLEIDLGAKYWLERVRMLTTHDPLTAYQLRLSDGRVDPSGGRIWNVLDERLNRENFIQLEEQFPVQEVRYIELRRLELIGASEETGNLSEIQAYGEGFVSDVELTSPIIRLPGSRMFTDLEWEGEAPLDTRLEIRTRSGDDLVPVSQFFDRFGREISEEQWNSISESNRGEVIREEIPGPTWSNWSELYQVPGEPFRSPSPRRFAMVQVRLVTNNPLRTAALRTLGMGLAPPLVDQVFAEMWPVDGVVPGTNETFTLYVQPRFRSGDPGFDRLRISSSSSSPLIMQELRSGSEASLTFGSASRLWPGTAELLELEAGDIELVFPAPIAGGRDILAATFQTQVFLNGTTFRAELTSQARPGVVQVASEGQAITTVESQSMVVVATLEKAPLLQAIDLVPPVFTPNGDGVNDLTRIQFAIFRLKNRTALSITLFDLGGRPVRDLSIVRDQPSGLHSVAWDGRDAAGKLVPPGSYLARVAFDTDADAAGTSAVGVVRVAY